MSSGGGAGPLVPTFHGFVHNSMDGLVLFEACLSGKLHHVPRRPHDRERASLIKSGSIFIYEENASGIKRWTDGVAWSPSRILGNFLIYRELEKPFPPGEKKRAMKRKRASLPGEPYPRRDSDDNEPSEIAEPPPPPSQGGEVKPENAGTDQDKELERSLIGSLVDSYGFRPDGLVKKTMSISVNGISHHMVSYYKVDDVKNQLLPRPLSDARLQNISVRPELYLKQNFRAPVEETEHYAIDGHMHAHPSMMYSQMPNYGGVRPGQYFGGQQYQMYSMSTTAPNMYGGMTAPAWPGQQAPGGGMQYGHPAYGQQPYSTPYYKGGNSSESPAQPVKSEGVSQGGSYNGQYGANYANMPRDGSQGTPSVAQSAYQTPVPPGSSTFAGRQSYGGPTSPTTNGQSQHMYSSAPSQAYAVRSPPQQHNYSVSSAPNSAVIPSPHNGVRSPVSGGPGSAPNSGDPYRGGSYAGAQGGHANGDVSGLGISNTSNYPAPPQNGGSYAYPGGQQPYRPEVAAGQNAPYAS